LGERLHAWPRRIELGDMFSGAGSFHQIFSALISALQKKFPLDMNDVKAQLNLLFIIY
jgi:hypothetical protein